MNVRTVRILRLFDHPAYQHTKKHPFLPPNRSFVPIQANLGFRQLSRKNRLRHGKIEKKLTSFSAHNHALDPEGCPDGDKCLRSRPTEAPRVEKTMERFKSQHLWMIVLNYSVKKKTDLYDKWPKRGKREILWLSLTGSESHIVRQLFCVEPSSAFSPCVRRKVSNNSIGVNQTPSLQKSLYLILGYPRKPRKLGEGHKLVRILFAKLPDLAEECLTVPLAASGQNHDVLGIDNASFVQHGS